MKLFATYGKNFNMVSAETPGRERKTNKQRENMSLQVVGKVHEVGESQQITDTFVKRDLIVAVVDTDPKFTEYVKFEATNDRVSLFDNLNVGDSVEVNFNLRGKPWVNKDGVTSYFNSLVAWKVNALNAQEQGAEPALF